MVEAAQGVAVAHLLRLQGLRQVPDRGCGNAALFCSLQSLFGGQGPGPGGDQLGQFLQLVRPVLVAQVIRVLGQVLVAHNGGQAAPQDVVSNGNSNHAVLGGVSVERYRHGVAVADAARQLAGCGLHRSGGDLQGKH